MISAQLDSTVGEALEAYLRIEDAIDGSLEGVIRDTESSAQSIIKHIRRLYDSANTLASYLDGTSLQVGDLGKSIIESVAFLSEVGTFIDRLPAKMEHDLKSVQAVVEEIKSLSEMTSEVKGVSLQSHLLAANAAVEASRAGSAGAAFKVVADEMRRLAATSNAMAVKMNKGLSRAQEIVKNGLQSTISESSRQLAEVSHAAASLRKLQNNFDDMSQYYKTRFSVVIKHNEDLVKDIADALGQIQYQDVVRQCIERIRIVAARRNEALRGLMDPNGDDSACLTELPVQLELILDDYMTEERKHCHSERQSRGGDSPKKIEMF